MINSARWLTHDEQTSNSQIEFTYEDGSKRSVVYSWPDAKKERRATGSVMWIQESELTPPTKTIESYKMTLEEAKSNFQNNLDASVDITKSNISKRNGIYDGDDPDYFLNVWPEFFALQKWINDGKPGGNPARPETPILDMHAKSLQKLIDPDGSAGYTLGNARGRLRAQLNNRRFKIMVENIDGTSGDLIDFKLRQPVYLSMQKEEKQYRFSEINGSTLSDNEKANQIQALAETMVKSNGEPKPFFLDDDPLDAKVSY